MNLSGSLARVPLSFLNSFFPRLLTHVIDSIERCEMHPALRTIPHIRGPVSSQVL